jgi:hypothetical protein
MGTPFLRRITLQDHATPAGKSSAIKIERRQAAYKPVALTLRHVQWVAPVVVDLETSQPLSNHLQECFTVHRLRLENGECPYFLLLYVHSTAARRPTCVSFQERKSKRAWKDQLDGLWSLDARNRGSTRLSLKMKRRIGKLLAVRDQSSPPSGEKIKKRWSFAVRSWRSNQASSEVACRNVREQNHAGTRSIFNKSILKPDPQSVDYRNRAQRSQVDDRLYKIGSR